MKNSSIYVEPTFRAVGVLAKKALCVSGSLYSNINKVYDDEDEITTEEVGW